MFRQRHELHVREAFLLHVGDQLVGELAVVVHVLAPAGGIHLVDADRAVMRVFGRTLGKPIGVIPLMVGLDHDGSGARRNLMGAFHRIGLHGPLIVGVENLILIDFASADARDEQFPDTRGSEFTHGVGTAIPAVEVADHTHCVGVRSPHGERSADHLLVLYAFGGTHRVVVAEHMRAKRIPQALVASFAKQIHVHLADGRQITIGIVGNNNGTVFIFGANAVIRHAVAFIGGDSGNECHEDAIVFMDCECLTLLSEDRHGFCQRTQDANRDDIRVFAGAEVTTEHLVGIVERTVAYCIQCALGNGNSNDIFIDLGFCSHGKSVSMKCKKSGPCRAYFFVFSSVFGQVHP